MTIFDLSNTAIVIDSTADMPADLRAREGIFMVPLTVHFGNETFRDVYDLSNEEFFRRLEASTDLPTTSQPAPREFERCYAEILEDYEHVLSIHISQKMSGTIASARAAASAFPAVEVFDSGTVALAITLLVERVRGLLTVGTEADEVRAHLEDFRKRSKLVVHPGTLEYLRRGGRIGRAQSMVGGILGIRPIIEMVEGELAPYAKVRGAGKMLEAMAAYLEANSTEADEISVALIHADAPEMIAPLRRALQAVRPQTKFLLEGPCGAVVGTHIGPGSTAFGMIVG